MAQRIVHFTEAVKVDENYRQRLIIALCHLQREGQLLMQQGSISKPGQNVVARLVLKFLLLLAGFRNVTACQKHTDTLLSVTEQRLAVYLEQYLFTIWPGQPLF